MLKKLRKALKWYADPKNRRKTSGLGRRRPQSAMDRDGGERARKALGRGAG